MKKAFSMIFAVMFLIIVATISALSYSVVFIGNKSVEDSYLLDQAEILARNATEFAVYAAQRHDYSKDNVVENINIYYPNKNNSMLDANVKIYYMVGAQFPKSIKGTNLIRLKEKDNNSSKILAMKIYTTVKSDDNLNISEPINFTRVTTQIP